MVTMPGEAADDYTLVRNMLASGMDCMRINCAYDDQDRWGRMIANLKTAKEELGRNCCVLMDLAGPKLRTGPIEPGHKIIKWRPRRDESGRVKSPAKIWLTSPEITQSIPASVDISIPVPMNWLTSLPVDSTIKFFDARGSSRSMRITAIVGENRLAESVQTSYLQTGTLLHVGRPYVVEDNFSVHNEARVLDLPAKSQSITLRTGDLLILTNDSIPGHSAIMDKEGAVLSPASIGVTLPEIFSCVKPGEPVFLDDGKIGGVIIEVDKEQIKVEITHAPTQGAKLQADKGINLPGSDLNLPSLTDKDVEDLKFISTHADLVGYSFVRSEADVFDLQSRLAETVSDSIGIILKIETRKAFECLPELLLAAMRNSSAGVMIARGDLAVECGYERMAEIQEEVLWICEAGHIPVIWATQVLENLAKQGLPSRAEITDAAMGERAECVMLNKGAYITDAIHALDDILKRMQAHQLKKSSMLRQLTLAGKFFEDPTVPKSRAANTP
jgi:pyruvate kinase